MVGPKRTIKNKEVEETAAEHITRSASRLGWAGLSWRNKRNYKSSSKVNRLNMMQHSYTIQTDV